MKKRNFLLLASSLALLAGCSQKSDITIALGGKDVPVGQYSDKILEYYGISKDDLEKKGIATFESDVKAVTSKVTQATVSCGIIYQTDAYSASLQYVDTATQEMCGRCVYPIAAIKNSAGKKDAAVSFMAYLTSDEAMSEFTGVGFKREAAVKDPVAQTSETITLNIYAAASMTESLNAVKAKYAVAQPNVTLSINYGSSGALKKQIVQGPDNCDIFISAGQKQMNELATSEVNLVETDTRFDILENHVVLAVPKDNPAKLESFADLAERLKAQLAK